MSKSLLLKFHKKNMQNAETKGDMLDEEGRIDVGKIVKDYQLRFHVPKTMIIKWLNLSTQKSQFKSAQADCNISDSCFSDASISNMSMSNDSINMTRRNSEHRASSKFIGTTRNILEVTSGKSKDQDISSSSGVLHNCDQESRVANSHFVSVAELESLNKSNESVSPSRSFDNTSNSVKSSSDEKYSSNYKRSIYSKRKSKFSTEQILNLVNSVANNPNLEESKQLLKRKLTMKKAAITKLEMNTMKEIEELSISIDDETDEKTSISEESNHQNDKLPGKLQFFLSTLSWFNSILMRYIHSIEVLLLIELE